MREYAKNDRLLDSCGVRETLSTEGRNQAPLLLRRLHENANARRRGERAEAQFQRGVGNRPGLERMVRGGGLVGRCGIHARREGRRGTRWVRRTAEGRRLPARGTEEGEGSRAR